MKFYSAQELMPRWQTGKMKKKLLLLRGSKRWELFKNGGIG